MSSISAQINYTSNRLYNDGLSKATVRDISGAIECLKKSLELNKRNTDARNLLGLCYYEIGEITAALAEWTISRHYNPDRENPAYRYLTTIQSNTQRLDVISKTLENYNQALMYSYQGSYDLAIIQLKKVLTANENLLDGYALLGLLYYETEEYEKARRTFVRALKIDRNNTKLLRYLQETDEVLHEIDVQSQDGKKKVQRPGVDSMTYESGMDTIIQPVYEKEKIGFSSIVNILIGIVVGVLICYFLILPARIDKVTEDFDAKYIDISEQLANEQALHNQETVALTNITAERDRLKAELADATGASGKLRPEDYIIQAANLYISNPSASQDVMSILENVSEEDVNSKSADFKALYQALMGETGPKVIEAYVDAARTAMKGNDYEEAITQYEKAYALDPSDSDVLMNLAHAYRQNDNLDKANELYRKIISDFPDTQNAADASEYITEN